MDEDRVRRYINYTRWVWFTGSAIALVGASVILATGAGTIVVVIVALTMVQCALAIPAAWLLPQRFRWARLMLIVLGALSFGALYQAFVSQAWASLILNLFLASTVSVLQNRDVKEAFAAAARERKSANPLDLTPVTY
ncbi:hypothetical protein [Rhodococcus marinonascens]|uniref:hypothetical protein n=1 Tax=Rhodococcus marinonascens TaxID=38311 RepID=UPI0009336F3F|nr:hypothetical protein [Rhodococcus marinonascens]